MKKTAQVNKQYFFLFAVLLYLTFSNLSLYSYFALLISVYQFCLVFVSVNSFIPIRYLAGLLMCLQMLVGPALAYNGLDQYQEGFSKMQIPESEYFSYVIPAVVFFIAGLNIFTKNHPGEKPDIERIKTYLNQHPNIPYIFIVIGFLTGTFYIYFSADIAFVFLILSGFKFVGVFIIILGNKYIKPLPLVLVYGSIIVSSIAQGMFFDLLSWVTFLGSIYALKLKPKTIFKTIFVVIFAILAVVIQQLKGDYREATWQQGQVANIETMKKTLKMKDEKSGIFSAENLGNSNLRINQGYIITNIMKTVPDKVSFENGNELLQILEAAFLPRIIAPNKLNAGDRFIFTKYSGIPVISGTSMGLSSIGDAYINFGVWGGCIFMFFYGLLFSYFLKLFYNKSKEFPIVILFATVAFYYPIRPDCELQTILGHLFKATLIIFVIVNVWRYNFRVSKIKNLNIS